MTISALAPDIAPRAKAPDATQKLTALTITKLAPRVKRYQVPDRQVTRLYLTVQPSGARSYCVRYRFEGRLRKLTLGSCNALDLTAARKLATTALRTLAEGQDPAAVKIAARVKEQAGLNVLALFGDVVEKYMREHVRPTCDSAAEIERIFNVDVLPRFGRRPLRDITGSDLKALFAAIMARGTPGAANAVFVAVRTFFNWCVRELVPMTACGTVRLTVSPCHGFKKPSKEKARTRFLSDAELATVWNACDAMGYPFGPLYQLLILTGSRREEVGGMQWSEVDLPSCNWTIPAERSKNGLEHVVHLSPAAVAILQSLPVMQCPYVFTRDGKAAVVSYSDAKRRLDANIAATVALPLAPFRVHDFRRTFVTGLAKLGTPPHVAERCVNHISGTFGGVQGVYNVFAYMAERRVATDAWAAHVTG